jgi:hypothetical protein
MQEMEFTIHSFPGFKMLMNGEIYCKLTLAKKRKFKRRRKSLKKRKGQILIFQSKEKGKRSNP